MSKKQVIMLRSGGGRGLGLWAGPARLLPGWICCCCPSLTAASHLCESGPDHEAAEAEEERGEAFALQTLHQHTHLRRHR